MGEVERLGVASSSWEAGIQVVSLGEKASPSPSPAPLRRAVARLLTSFSTAQDIQRANCSVTVDVNEWSYAPFGTRNRDRIDDTASGQVIDDLQNIQRCDGPVAADVEPVGLVLDKDCADRDLPIFDFSSGASPSGPRLRTVLKRSERTYHPIERLPGITISRELRPLRRVSLVELVIRSVASKTPLRL